MREAIIMLAFCLSVLLHGSAVDGATIKEDQVVENPKRHFMIVSSAKQPAPDGIAKYLETTWQTFHDVFGVNPATVKVVISPTSGAGAPSSQSDQERPSGQPAHQIAWAIKEGDALSSQTFSDLSHEITHIYFIDYMEDKGGMHQGHAWLHEAVACYSERDPYRKNREQWARDHINDRIPFEQLFTMKNPQKENPLVELIVKLHEKLARGEIKVEDLNRQVSEFATAHAAELSQAGIRNMTYYSESLSIFEFLLKTEGKEFIRRMCQALKKGKSMAEIIRDLKAYPNGIPQFEQAWVDWVQKS
ncbi:MAG TPA: hypothetical protein VLX12_08595 [Syntrophorhabdales bacterium]|nr:hypothetical protein [Syntrophorhabdales bacterium]